MLEAAGLTMIITRDLMKIRVSFYTAGFIGLYVDLRTKKNERCQDNKVSRHSWMCRVSRSEEKKKVKRDSEQDGFAVIRSLQRRTAQAPQTL